MEKEINFYTIKDLEDFSGIKAHTIRIWEKRYKILAPTRTETNIRKYSESELKKILNVAYLNSRGLKISKIALLDDDKLTQRVITESSSNDEADKNFHPGKLLMAAIRFSENLFNEALDPYIKHAGMEEAFIKYLHPLLEKSKILWQTGSLTKAQEQFVRSTINKLLLYEDSSLTKSGKKNAATFAMVNLYDRWYDNNLLFYRYILKKRGFDLIYPGGSLPPTEVVEIHKIKPFQYLAVNSGTYGSEDNLIEYFSKVARQLKIKKIIFTDHLAKVKKQPDEKMLFSKDPAGFIKLIDSLF
jgi:DNA-binding transcriptional MerR regulator